MISKLEDVAKVGTETYIDLVELCDTIPLLHWMVSEQRPHAKDLERKNGKIIVDITRPHIIKDVDYFQQAAINFKKYSKYTDYYPSKSPSSPYKKFWDEEIRRCRDGYVRESDGEWVTGYYYFYLNYSPILKTEVIGERNEDGSIQADRVEGFPDFWDGDYLFYHYVDQAEKSGQYGTVLKARGKGYSFKAASMMNRNYALYKQAKSFALAADTEYLTTDGILNKAWDIFSFITTHVGFAKKLVLVDKTMHKMSGYKKSGEAGLFGARSEMIGVTLKNDPDKARGKRGKIILWEEAGSFPHILKSWRLAQKSLEDGQRVFGFMLAFGTGGEEGVDFIGLESLFYNSKAYRVYNVANVWDRGASKAKCAFFVPDYLNRADCYDKDGNSDVVKAVAEVIAKRLDVKYNSNDATDFAQVKAEEPFTPQEAVMRTEGTVFPVADLKEYIATVEPNREHFVGQHYIGELTWKGSDNVKFTPKFDISPIRDWPYKGRDKSGAIEIFELPKIDSNTGKPPWGRYIGGVDPVDDDEGTSLFSVEIFDLFTDTQVAEWTGRLHKADLNFEIALKLAVFYNAEINYENKLKGLFAYFERMNAMRYLADTPAILKDMDYIKHVHATGNKSKGTPPTQTINSWGRRLQADWMMSKSEYQEDTLNLQRIRSIGYLKEAIQWNIDGNFDRISRSNMTFILRAAKLKYVESNKNKPKEEVDAFSNDPFFKDNPAIPTLGIW